MIYTKNKTLSKITAFIVILALLCWIVPSVVFGSSEEDLKEAYEKALIALETAQEEVAKAESDLESAQMIAAEAGANLEAAKEELNIRNENYASAAPGVEKLKEKLTFAQAAADEANSFYERMKETGSEEEINVAKEVAEKANAELESASAEYNNANSNLMALQNELDGAKAEFDEAKSAADEANTNLQNAEQVLNEKNENLNIAQAEVERTKAELEAYLAEIAEKETDIEEGASDGEDTDEEILEENTDEEIIEEEATPTEEDIAEEITGSVKFTKTGLDEGVSAGFTLKNVGPDGTKGTADDISYGEETITGVAPGDPSPYALWTGIPAGSGYYIKETTTPAGYNTMADIDGISITTQGQVVEVNTTPLEEEQSEEEMKEENTESTEGATSDEGVSEEEIIGEETVPEDELAEVEAVEENAIEGEIVEVTSELVLEDEAVDEEVVVEESSKLKIDILFSTDENGYILAGEVTAFSAAVEGIVPLQYFWDFGDGSSSSQQNPQYAYSNEGNYTLSLTILDTDGNAYSKSVIVHVSDYNPNTTEYWISSDAIDEGTGSIDDPFTIDAALSHTVNGDTLYFLPGTYNTSVNLDGIGTGTEELPIEFIAYDDVIFDGQSTLDYAFYFSTPLSYLSFYNFTFINYLNSVIYINNEDVTNIEIVDNTFSNNGTAIDITMDSDLNIQNNIIVDNDAGVVISSDDANIEHNIIAFNQEGIVVDDTRNNITVDYNDVFGNETDYQGVEPGENDISVDPMFADKDNLDFTLLKDSPLLDNKIIRMSSTDKDDYYYGEQLVITGSGYNPFQDLIIKILRPDGTFVKNILVTTDENGNFTYKEYYVDYAGKNYLVEIIDAEGNILEVLSFTDNPINYYYTWPGGEHGVDPDNGPYVKINTEGGDLLGSFNYDISTKNDCPLGFSTIIWGVFIKAGNNSLVIIDEDGDFNLDGSPGNCYRVSGIGTSIVTVTELKQEAHTAPAISNIRFYYRCVQRGSITGKKTDGTSGLGGATIGLYTSSDGINFVEVMDGGVHVTVVSEANGTVKFENLELGTYYIHETAAPSGYTADTAYYGPAELTEASPHFTFTAADDIENTKILGSITGKKTDGTSGLGGATIGLYTNSAADGSGTWTKVKETTSGAGGSVYFDDLDLDTNYWVHEITAPSGYTPVQIIMDRLSQLLLTRIRPFPHLTKIL